MKGHEGLSKFKREEFVDAFLVVVKQSLLEELPESGFEDMLAYEAYQIMRRELRHINVAMVLAKAKLKKAPNDKR